jgi:hypothetical protein
MSLVVGKRSYIGGRKENGLLGNGSGIICFIEIGDIGDARRRVEDVLRIKSLQSNKQFMLTRDIPPHHPNPKERSRKTGTIAIGDFEGCLSLHQFGEFVLEKNRNAGKIDADIVAALSFLYQVRKDRRT